MNFFVFFFKNSNIKYNWHHILYSIVLLIETNMLTKKCIYYQLKNIKFIELKKSLEIITWGQLYNDFFCFCF